MSMSVEGNEGEQQEDCRCINLKYYSLIDGVYEENVKLIYVKESEESYTILEEVNRGSQKPLRRMYQIQSIKGKQLTLRLNVFQELDEALFKHRGQKVVTHSIIEGLKVFTTQDNAFIQTIMRLKCYHEDKPGEKGQVYEMTAIP